MVFRNKKQPYVIPDGFRKIGDGYTENPFAHHEESSEYEREREYFMQWVLPLKLQRVALRTPVGFRIIYIYSEDLWNNRLGIKILNEKEKTEKVNKLLLNYLMSRGWYTEMEKLSAYEREQGEAILLCYYDDQGDLDKYWTEVTPNDEILGVEAFHPIHYHIPEFDKYGHPARYRIQVKTPDNWRGFRTVDVHPSRVLRKTANNVEYRFTGYSDLAAVYDPIVILSTILKAVGEAAFRWGTGHPIILTKDIFNDIELDKVKGMLGNITRRSHHVIPSEKIDRIEMIGQAGAMINFKALADICIDQIVIGTGIPRPILLGEVAGIISGSEVNERSYFSLLDKDHTDLEPFVRKYFERDVNVRRLFNGIEYYELDWGIREVHNKMDEAELLQKMASLALALTQICTINEARKIYGLEEIEDEIGGDVILGLIPYTEMMFNMEMQAEALEQQKEMETHGEAQTTTSMNQKSRSTEKKAASIKEPEKNKRVAPPTRDTIIEKAKKALIDLRKEVSINDLQKEWNMYDKTIYKLLNWAKDNKIKEED